MKTLKLFTATLLITLSIEGYSNNKCVDNTMMSNYITPISQENIKIVSTFKVNAKVARFVGAMPNQYLKYTNQTTLTIAIYTNNKAYVIAVGDKQRGIQLPIRIALFQDDYTFECSDHVANIIYCFNTSKLQ